MVYSSLTAGRGGSRSRYPGWSAAGGAGVGDIGSTLGDIGSNLMSSSSNSSNEARASSSDGEEEALVIEVLAMDPDHLPVSRIRSSLSSSDGRRRLQIEHLVEQSDEHSEAGVAEWGDPMAEV
jgi:hypothetical protein